MVGAFQTYPITISRLQVIFIAIRIQVIFTSNKCIDDASLALQWRRLWHWGWSVLWQNPCCPARARWLCYLLWHRGSCTQFIIRMGRLGLNTVTLWWPNGSVAKAEPVTKCHSVWTPRHTCHTFPPTWSQTLDGHLPNLYLETADIFAWCFSEILGFHLLAIFCIYLYGEREWTR